jgi:FtsX-like permease family protein
MAGALRRISYPLRLAAARLAHRRTQAALVAFGVAAGAGILAAVLAGSVIAQDRSLARALADVPSADRALRAGYFGVPPQSGDYRRELDAFATRALARLVPGEPIRAMQLRQTRIDGALVDLAALDDSERWVRLRSGRFPRACTPVRCEVIQLAGRGRIPSAPGIRLVRVGTGVLTSPLPFGTLSPQGISRASIGVGNFAVPRTPPFLVADGVAALSALPELESIYRGHSWVMPLEPGAVHPWEVDEFTARVTRVRSELEVRSYLFDLTGPDVELRAAAESSRVAGRRLLLIGGEAAALLLAFAVLVAASLRRDVDAAWQRLTWFGARRWQRVLLAVAESAAVVLVGTVAGWALGTGVALFLADGAGSPPGAVVAHSVLSGSGIAIGAGLAVAATVVLFVSLRARPVRLGVLSFSAADVAALGALVTVTVALIRGEANPRVLAEEQGTGTLLLLLPGLIVFIAAVAAARALAPVLRLLERIGRRAAVPLRLAALSLARNPGHAAVAVVFLVVSLGLAVFAEAYRSTLARGQADQAAFAIPLDFTLREDLSPGGLVSPLEAAPLARYRALGPDVEVVPLVRLRGSVSRLGGSARVTLLGLPADGLAALPDWRDDFASVSANKLANRIHPTTPIELRGPRLPEDASALVVPVDVDGDNVDISVSVATARGEFVRLDFGEVVAGRHELRAKLPSRARGGRVVALTFRPPPRSIESGEPAQGVLELGGLAVRRPGGVSLVSDYRGWIGVNGVNRGAAEGATRMRYFVTDQLNSHFRPAQPTSRPVPAIASPRLAAAAGPEATLVVQLAGPRVAVEIVATARRFPTVAEGDFVVADRAALATALNADSPGSAVVNEIWVGASSTAAKARVEDALRRSPFDVLEVHSRDAVEERLESDPLSRGALATLAGAAAAALLLALAGLMLAVVSDVRDERGELFDLEAQGAGPETLRRHLRLRALLLAAFGLLGGLVAGAILSALVVDLVALTANATTPEPPLLLTVDWTGIALAVASYTLLALALVWTATWNSFRAPVPARAPEVGA